MPVSDKYFTTIVSNREYEVDSITLHSTSKKITFPLSFFNKFDAEFDQSSNKRQKIGDKYVSSFLRGRLGNRIIRIGGMRKKSVCIELPFNIFETWQKSVQKLMKLFQEKHNEWVHIRASHPGQVWCESKSRWESKRNYILLCLAPAFVRAFFHAVCWSNMDEFVSFGGYCCSPQTNYSGLKKYIEDLPKSTYNDLLEESLDSIVWSNVDMLQKEFDMKMGYDYNPSLLEIYNVTDAYKQDLFSVLPTVTECLFTKTSSADALVQNIVEILNTFILDCTC